jgi:hypothetical protein
VSSQAHLNFPESLIKSNQTLYHKLPGCSNGLQSTKVAADSSPACERELQEDYFIIFHVSSANRIREQLYFIPLPFYLLSKYSLMLLGFQTLLEGTYYRNYNNNNNNLTSRAEEDNFLLN